jgi:hypothetical protein
VQRILAEQPLHPEKVKYYLERRDPNFEAKMCEILLVYREVALQNQNPGGLAPVIVTVSVDEKPGLQAIANRRTCRQCRPVRECGARPRAPGDLLDSSGVGPT